MIGILNLCTCDVHTTATRLDENETMIQVKTNERRGKGCEREDSGLGRSEKENRKCSTKRK
jgi:hypothetical protein